MPQKHERELVTLEDYLIGEKLLIYAETAMTRPEFARELPRFIAEVREITLIADIWPRSVISTSVMPSAK